MKKLLSFMSLLGLFTQIALAEQPAASPPKAAQNMTQAAETKMGEKATIVQLNQVNINTATAAEIQDKLVGIGAKKAQAIVEYREKNGKFIRVDQLTEVSGIGKATLDKNRDRIVIE